MSAREAYLDWRKRVSDVELARELETIEDNADEIEARFYQGLAFGTGGLRGVIGAGTARMNVYVIERATLGLGEYLLKTVGEGASVAIAYDSRRKSYEFAVAAANALISKGIKAYVFGKLTPTPVLSFAVRALSASAGIVITASHNPKEYNGYKVYNDKGCQITDDAAAEITREIEKLGYFNAVEPAEDKIVWLGDELEEAFLSEIEKYSFETIGDELSVVYTPLNGTGKVYVEKGLRRRGVKRLHLVSEQAEPDSEFTTCPYPNPEEREALTLAIRDGEKFNADIVLATDPDADRVGALVRRNGEFVRLNGNETGVLILNYLFSQKAKSNTLGKNPCVIKTIVTTDMAQPIASRYGATVKEVLTGFKYIGEELDKTENYVCGFEESYGYLIGDHVRDKDAVSAACLIVEMAAHYKRQGKTLADVLDELNAEYGYFRSHLTSFAFGGIDGMDKMKALLSGVRKTPWETLSGEKAVMTDYSTGVNGLPGSNVLQFRSERNKVTVRPSGTEPKLKVYFEVIGESGDDAQAKMQALIDETLARLK